MPEIVFASLAAGRKGASRVVLSAESIHTFSGQFSVSPVWMLVPESRLHLAQPVPPEFSLETIPFWIDQQVLDFPFAAKVVAAAAAETLAADRALQLVWMDSGSLVVNPPHDLVLGKGVKLACRPVDHLLIGSPYDQPIDEFWAAVYQSCAVSQERVFPMRTSADQVEIRPYINAGMLVVRPEQQLLRLWRDKFLEIYQQTRFLEFYQQDYLYRIFIHQAVLAGCILSILKQDEIFELPHWINYPLHMHSQYPPNLRPPSLNELVSFRYEEFFTDPSWRDQVKVKGKLKSWLEENLTTLSGA